MSQHRRLRCFRIGIRIQDREDTLFASLNSFRSIGVGLFQIGIQIAIRDYALVLAFIFGLGKCSSYNLNDLQMQNAYIEQRPQSQVWHQVFDSRKSSIRLRLPCPRLKKINHFSALIRSYIISTVSDILCCY